MRRSAPAGGEDTAYAGALRCLARRDRSEADDPAEFLTLIEQARAYFRGEGR